MMSPGTFSGRNRPADGGAVFFLRRQVHVKMKFVVFLFFAHKIADKIEPELIPGHRNIIRRIQKKTQQNE